MRPPSVDSLARKLATLPDLARVGHTSLVRCARTAIQESPENAEAVALRLAHNQARLLMTPVINATGVLLHTNLGRAPALKATHSTPSSNEAIRYSNLEFDLTKGARGSRRALLEPLLCSLTGAEAALVVNNCAAAVMLALAAHASGRGVAVSRGEMVEIGGGFRIPDVLEVSGATLVEVGTTNRTRLQDYANAIEMGAVPVKAILKVHQSNYRMVGFVEETPLEQLAGLGVPIFADIGSGLLDSEMPWLADKSGKVPPLPWLQGEPGARQCLKLGAALVIFSGDKLLGGPQSGIIVGAKSYVDICAKHPLARALRPGSAVIAELQETLLAYARGEARSIPFWNMAVQSKDTLQLRADQIVAAVNSPLLKASPMDAVPGGGTLPDRTILSFGLSVVGQFAEALREMNPPIISRTQDGLTLLDLRTVDPADDQLLEKALVALCAEPHDVNGTS
jgi:L-seryl-tRNA(Ser) seleniumtransferase